jgi:hypothetical protein
MNQDNGGIIGKINTPTTSVASGVWSIQDQFEAQSSSIWPLAFPQTTFTSSVRLNKSDSPYLNRTNGTATNNDKYTLSLWTKRGLVSSAFEFLMEGWTANGDTTCGILRFRGDDRLDFMGYSTVYRRTTRVFRDTSAWYNIIIAVDTTQSTASDRIKMYINGVEETEFDTNNNPSQNANTGINNDSANLNLFRRYLGSSNDLHYGGYCTEYILIDGQQLTPTSFGATNPVTNIWEPIAYTGTYGTNGFKLNFSDSSNLGDDTSGNGNDFTANNLASTDQSTDTCSNNFATLSPLVTLSGGTLSEANLKYNYGSNGWRSSFSTIGANKGKWYCEVKFDSGTYLVVGIVDEDGYSRNSGNFLADSTFNYSHGYGYYSNDGHGNSTGKDGQGTDVTYGDTFAAGDIIGIAMDLDNGKLYFSKNGTFQNSGDPTSGSTGTGSVYNITNSTTLNYFFGVSPYNATALLNTGSPSFSISSGNADANGHGNFEYAVPSGYFALCTKNLAEHG